MALYRCLVLLASIVSVISVQMSMDLELRAASDRPNVVVVLSDDQGFGDFSHCGNNDISTPNIDSLARDGAFFKNFYVCPVCAPTRAEFLTGRYHQRDGVIGVSCGAERLSLEVKTIANAFSDAGYATAAFGKWHNGMQPPWHPVCRGFDEFYGFCSGHWGHYFSPPLDHNNSIVRGEGFLPDDLTNHAIEFIKGSSRESKPFFVFLPFNTPHSPMQVPDRFWEKFRDKDLKQLPDGLSAEEVLHARAALAMCENLDENVGRVLKELERLQIQENTIVVYFCDNGPNGRRFNAGLKGLKGSVDEGGVRSPLFVRWPKGIAADRAVATIAGAIDLLPTLAELCSVPLPAQSIDGVSLVPLLTGSAESNSELLPRYDREIFSHWNTRFSARDARYRLDAKGKLFDLLADPQQNNPIEDPEVKVRLSEALKQFRVKAVPENRVVRGKNALRGLFRVGDPSHRNTQLPAQDALVNGQIKRSNRYPNSSWFTDWTDVDDFIFWEVEVAQAGQYEVEVYYCLDKSDVGVELSLSAGHASVTAQINEPNQCALIGQAEDRSPRKESLMKDFQPIKLGRITLSQGPQLLKLETRSMPGKRSIDFSTLILKKVGN